MIKPHLVNEIFKPEKQIDYQVYCPENSREITLGREPEFCPECGKRLTHKDQPRGVE